MNIILKKDINDPLAKIVKWDNNHKILGGRLKNILRENDDGIILIKGLDSYVVMTLVFLFIIGMLSQGILNMYLLKKINSEDMSITIVALFILLLLTFLLKRDINTDRIFNKKMKMFIVSKKGKDLENISFDFIHAIQLIDFYEQKHNSYQLNLILRDSSRVYVLEKSEIDKIKHDAEKISLLLQVPIWNGIEFDDEEEIA